ncbi:MAG: alpha/beta hydrolase [Candidatus Hydrogenedens sp.]|jgi:acetyl esterase/lipase|nr:alpha/beta hydrolase [Candidatus Hydrogenedens sp.]
MKITRHLSILSPAGLSLLLFLFCAFAVIVNPDAGAALIETEEELVALEEPPALPANINQESDLHLAVGKGEVTLLNLSDPVPVPETVIETTDIEYGRVGDRALLLDLYRPARQEGPQPGLIFIHGGGWSSGKKSDYKYYTVRFAQMGFVVATISYRFVQEAPFPACVEDAKCAVRWMRAHADEYGIRADAIAVAGGSAGGHLAMMLGYAADTPELEGKGGHEQFSSAVQAVINLYGPTDLTPEEFHNHPTLTAFFGGKSYDQVPESYALASPMHHLDKNDPPTLVIHGTDDSTVPVAQADLLVAQLEKLEIPHEYLRMKGYPHTLDILLEANQFVRWHMYRFLKTHLN